MNAYFLQNFITTNIRFKKTTLKGWRTCNAMCCTHNGESEDKRGRGGFNYVPDGTVVSHCFNCGFIASWRPGTPISHRFKKLLTWYGIPQISIETLVFDALELRTNGDFSNDTLDFTEIPVEFPDAEPPEGARTLEKMSLICELKDGAPNDFLDAVEYIGDRFINLEKYEFMWTPNEEGKFNRRIIVPFYHKKKLVGWTGRGIDNTINPKFLSSQPDGYVFNLDKQVYKNKVVIVCEGVFDAMTIDGVAVLHNDISQTQAALIESLGKDIIVVPDFDKSGGGLVDAALEYGWSVSYPTWGERYKDINMAVCKLEDKLFVLENIIRSVETNPTKIQLLKKTLAKPKGNNE